MISVFNIAIVLFLFQGVVIVSDEVFCHRRRVLPKWELVGHPVDTFCLVAFFISLVIVNPVQFQIPVLLLAVLSCLIITKDEWVHKEHSSGFENWLHAMLFLLHAGVVGLYFLLWTERHPGIQSLAAISAVGAGLFMLYQCVEGVRRWQKV